MPHYFIGKNRDNHVPISNGRILVWAQQYDEDCRPADLINQIFFPNFDLSNALLGEQGSFVLAKDKNEKVWYDPYGIVQQELGQVGEIISMDEARYINGFGIYEVISHKGNTIVSTKTWTPWKTNTVVRAIQVKTVKGNASEVDIFPVVHLKNVVERLGNVFISRIANDQWLAVTATPSIEGKTGDVGKAVTGGKVTIFEHSSVPASLSFHAKRTVPSNEYSEPIYLLFSAGKSKDEAISQLQSAAAGIEGLYNKALLEWNEWHQNTTPIEGIPPALNYYWRVSNSLLKMSLQEDGAPLIIGFRPYQGNIWVRDGLWMVTTLALAGHHEEATKGLYKLIDFLKQRPDGNYYFAYNVTTGTPNEHAFENDTTGLLLYGIWKVYKLTKNERLLQNVWHIVEHSANWIVNNRDETGLVKEDAGIWETFGPHLGESFEHMTWTSGISAYGLLKASVIAQTLGKEEHALLYRKNARELINAIEKHNVHNGVVTRSLETKLLDASVLLFFTEFPLFPRDWLTPTVEAIEKRLHDPFLGGIWRHESLTTEEGDMRPWTGPTFWMGEALLAAGNRQKAWQYYSHNYHNSSYCGLLPELMYSKDMARGIAMPSYSQSGVIRSLLFEIGIFHQLDQS